MNVYMFIRLFLFFTFGVVFIHYAHAAVLTSPALRSSTGSRSAVRVNNISRESRSCMKAERCQQGR